MNAGHEIPRNEDLVTFHANFVKGKDAKIEKLKSIPLGWNPLAFQATTNTTTIAGDVNNNASNATTILLEGNVTMNVSSHT